MQRDNESRMLAAVRRTLSENLPESAEPERLSLNSHLERDLGMDSLIRAELFVAVEREFGTQLSEQLLGEAETPGDILEALEQGQGGAPTPAAGSAVGNDSPSPEADRERFEVPDFDTFVQALQWHAREHPRRTWLTLVEEPQRTRPLTYGALHEMALRVANGLLQRGLERGDRIALMLPTGLDYFHGFFGAQYAGGVPVPLYPPTRPSQLEEHLRRMAGVLNNAGARYMIAMPEARRLAPLIKGMVPTLEHVLTPDDVPAPEALAAPVPGVAADDLAFLQYTSGSTGAPKGVQLSHANLFANIRACTRKVEVDQDDVFVSWLPLYHDMGLIGTCLSTLWLGMHLVVMSPLLFLTRPRTWLWAIDHFGGTLSPSPNFGYELCLKRLDDEDLEGLDLGSWRVAFNGAEPVSPSTVERFIERFRGCGFRPGSMAPVYGLAENSVGLTFPERGREPVIDVVDRDVFMETGEARPAKEGDDTPLRFVGCGRVIPDHEIRVVDGDGRALPDRREGALQFRGPSATRGYFRNPEATEKLFDGDWLNTGDRAYLVDGELFVTGRSKDVIVRAGRNIYPTEIEDAVAELDRVRSGCVAAFASGMGEASGERLVVVAEVHELSDSERRQVKDAIHGITRERLGIDVDRVVLAPPRAIPKTSSGKLRRGETRRRYESGELGQKPRALWWQLARLAGAGWWRQPVHWLRTWGTRLYAGWAWCVFGLVAVPLFLVLNLVPGRAARWWLVHRAARLMRLLTATRLELQGGEQLRRLPRGCVMVANHASYLDGFVLAAASPVPVSFVVKEELTRFASLRRFIRLLDMVTVSRSGDEQSVRASRRMAEKAGDKRLLFFAEGTFDAAPGVRPFRMGAFMVATERQVPVVPVTLRGTRRKLLPRRWSPRPGGVAVTVDEPIRPAGRDWSDAVQLRDRVRRVILERSGEPDRLGG